MSWLEGIEESFPDEEPPECCLKCPNPTISLINPDIFIGDKHAPASLYLLKKHHITHVLSVCCGEFSHYPQTFVYKQIVVTDTPTTNISDHFEEAIDFIQTTVSNGGKVLIHCQGGVSRSVTFVVAYFMYKYRLSFANALEYVQNARPIANPNIGFRSQLLLYEKTILNVKK
jgi:protein-tyrosine phosphatase